MKLLYCVTVLTSIVFKANSVTNNVCRTFQDYYTIKDNPNCWYDIAAEGNATDVIQAYGYPVEVHKVTTADGYILSVFRIPNYNLPRKRPIFLQHGLLSSGFNYFARGKNSLPFVLADAGYDVWLGNTRGNVYSEGHVKWTVHDKQYWDHSLDEMGLYDMPAMLGLVSEKSGQKGNIVYIGYSIGTTVGMIYASALPHEAKQTLKTFIWLAPAATLSNMITPFRVFAPFVETILRIVNENDLIRVASQATFQNQITKLVCLESPVLMKRCLDIVNWFYGPKAQTEPSTFPVYLNQYPAGVSLKVIRHSADLPLNQFTKYNYGFSKNIAKYGSVSPPSYDVSKIQVPVFIMYAVNDWTCTKKDSLILYNNLSPAVKIYGIHEVTVSNFNHNDFLYGRDAKSIVYDNILKLLDRVH